MGTEYVENNLQMTVCYFSLRAIVSMNWNDWTGLPLSVLWPV